MTRELAEAGVPTFVRDELVSPERTRPIVMVSSTQRGGYHVDADILAAVLGSSVEVLKIRTGGATWALSRALPPSLACSRAPPGSGGRA
jgi:hypothetical protein